MKKELTEADQAYDDQTEDITKLTTWLEALMEQLKQSENDLKEKTDSVVDLKSQLKKQQKTSDA